MVNRPAGGARSQRWEREALDWYCEDQPPINQLMDALPPPRDAIIYDPSCGRGNILDVAKARGYRTLGSDIVERCDPCRHDQSSVRDRHDWFQADVFKTDIGKMLWQMTHAPAEQRPVTIINNPPYSYEPDICQRFIDAVLDWPIQRACFLVPIAFLCSAERYGFFTSRRPSQIAILCERPSCPPGSTLDPYTTFKGGMGDYVWLVFGPPHRWRTEVLWLKPS